MSTVIPTLVEEGCSPKGDLAGQHFLHILTSLAVLKGGFREWRVVHGDQQVMSSIQYHSEMKGRFSALISAAKSPDRN